MTYFSGMWETEIQIYTWDIIWNKDKSIFNHRHRYGSIQQSTVARIVNQFKTSGSVIINLNEKTPKKVSNEDLYNYWSTWITITEVQHPILRKRMYFIRNNVNGDKMFPQC